MLHQIPFILFVPNFLFNSSDLLFMLFEDLFGHLEAAMSVEFFPHDINLALWAFLFDVLALLDMAIILGLQSFVASMLKSWSLMEHKFVSIISEMTEHFGDLDPLFGSKEAVKLQSG